MPEQNPEQPADMRAQRASEGAPRIDRVWVRWRRARTAVPALIVLTLGCFVSMFACESITTRGRAASNVMLGDLDVSRFSSAEIERATARLESKLRSRKQRVLIEAAEFELEPDEIGFELDRKKTLRRVLDEGRNGSLLSRLWAFATRLLSESTVEPAAHFDRARLAALLEQWQAQAIEDRPVAGGLRIEGQAVQPVLPRAGRGVRSEVAEALLLAAVSSGANAKLRLPTESVAAPVEASSVERVAAQARHLLAGVIELTLAEPALSLRITPQALAPALGTRPEAKALVLEIDRARLESALAGERSRLEREATDAKFEVDAQERITILPSTPGLRIDFERLPSALMQAAATRSGELPVRFEPLPKLSTEEAQKLGVRGLVSSFTTRHACCERRVDNIHRIADLLNDVLVRPGETLSLNALVGPRTQKNGFVPAPTIEEGEFVDTPGGGISQFATTMFNALFYGGYDIVERQPHTYWFPRYPEGHEATLSWPKPDLIFRNDTEAGLVIKTVYTDKTITVKLYGDNGGRKVRAQVSSRSNITDPPMELVANASLEPNREKVKEGGAVGWSIVVSRVLTFADGTTREEKRRVTYKPKPRRIEVHPCRIPKGEKGYTGKPCPEPKDAEIASLEPEPSEP